MLRIQELLNLETWGIIGHGVGREKRSWGVYMFVIPVN